MTEPWGAYIPEVNAGRQETGAGPATWLASATMWTDFAALVGEAMAVMTAELAALGINWQGLAPTAMGAAVVPFMTWLATMEPTQRPTHSPASPSPKPSPSPLAP